MKIVGYGLIDYGRWWGIWLDSGSIPIVPLWWFRRLRGKK